MCSHSEVHQPPSLATHSSWGVCVWWGEGVGAGGQGWRYQTRNICGDWAMQTQDKAEPKAVSTLIWSSWIAQRARLHVHTHTHKYTRMHTCIHTHIHTNTHKHLNKHIYTHMYTNKHTYTHACKHTHVYTHTHIYPILHSQTCILM